MKIRNRDRRSEKTSERTRFCAGMMLVLISVVLCAFRALTSGYVETVEYRSGTQTRQIQERIGTERNGPVQVNTADAEELTALPGVGETLAALMIRERTENGPFRYVEDLLSVKGIGRKTLQKIRPLIDLSTTESEENDGIPCAVP